MRLLASVIEGEKEQWLVAVPVEGRKLRGATELQYELSKANLRIRTGIHAGEIEIRGTDIGGIAVHLAVRIMAEASAGEILVSRTVRDLVTGSDMAFQDRGNHTLKGIEGEWQLLSVEQPGQAIKSQTTG